MTIYQCLECETSWKKGIDPRTKFGMCNTCFAKKFNKKELHLITNWHIIDLKGARKVENV